MNDYGIWEHKTEPEYGGESSSVYWYKGWTLNYNAISMIGSLYDPTGQLVGSWMGFTLDEIARDVLGREQGRR